MKFDDDIKHFPASVKIAIQRERNAARLTREILRLERDVDEGKQEDAENSNVETDAQKVEAIDIEEESMGEVEELNADEGADEDETTPALKPRRGRPAKQTKATKQTAKKTAKKGRK